MGAGYSQGVCTDAIESPIATVSMTLIYTMPVDAFNGSNALDAYDSSKALTDNIEYVLNGLVFSDNKDILIGLDISSEDKHNCYSSRTSPERISFLVAPKS